MSQSTAIPPTEPPKAAPPQGEHAQEAVNSKTAVRRVGESLRVILRSVTSEDRLTRRMAYLFWFCVLGSLATVTYAWKRIHDENVSRAALLAAQDMDPEKESAPVAHKKPKAASEHGEGAGKDQAPEGSELYVRLGGFSFELKQQEGVKKLPTAINLAEIELMAQCDVAETCEEVAKHLTEIQSLISNVLIGVDYDTLLSQPGKGKLRDQIIERIERALGKGHIRNILFTKLVVS